MLLRLLLCLPCVRELNGALSREVDTVEPFRPSDSVVAVVLLGGIGVVGLGGGVVGVFASDEGIYGIASAAEAA